MPRYLLIFMLQFSLIYPVQPEDPSINKTREIPTSNNLTFPIGVPSVIYPPSDLSLKIHTVIKLICSPIVLFIHFTVNYILYVSKNRRKYTNVFYKLALVASFCCMYWCYWLIYQALCYILGHCLADELGNIMISIGAHYVFFLCMNIDLMIALNRFSAVALSMKHETIFSQTKGLLYIYLVVVLTAIEISPSFWYQRKYILELDTSFFYYHPPEGIVKFNILMELSLAYIVHLVLIILYVCSFISYKKHVVKSNTQKIEERLLYQGFISAIPCLLMITFHHLIRESSMSLLGSYWCTSHRPLVFLWFNKELRKDYMKTFGLKRIVEKMKKIKRGPNAIYSIDTQTAARTAFDTQTSAKTAVETQTAAGTAVETQIAAGNAVETQTAAGTAFDTQTAAGTAVETQTAARTAVETQTTVGTAVEKQTAAGTAESTQETPAS